MPAGDVDLLSVGQPSTDQPPAAHQDTSYADDFVSEGQPSPTRTQTCALDTFEDETDESDTEEDFFEDFKDD